MPWSGRPGMLHELTWVNYRKLGCLEVGRPAFCMNWHELTIGHWDALKWDGLHFAWTGSRKWARPHHSLWGHTVKLVQLCVYTFVGPRHKPWLLYVQHAVSMDCGVLIDSLIALGPANRKRNSPSLIVGKHCQAGTAMCLYFQSWDLVTRRGSYTSNTPWVWLIDWLIDCFKSS